MTVVLQLSAQIEKNIFRSGVWTLILFLLAQKDKSTMVKCKLLSGQNQLHYAANTTSPLC